MSTTSMIGLCTVMFTLNSTKNPVKLSILILMLALFMFMSIWVKTGNTWIPMIMFLLFTGGILVMFMILSSFHPNEENSKMKKLNMIMIMLVLMFILLSETETSNQTVSWSMNQSMKSLYQNAGTMEISMMLLMIYYYVFMKILGKENTAMRMNMC